MSTKQPTKTTTQTKTKQPQKTVQPTKKSTVQTKTKTQQSTKKTEQPQKKTQQPQKGKGCLSQFLSGIVTILIIIVIMGFFDSEDSTDEQESQVYNTIEEKLEAEIIEVVGEEAFQTLNYNPGNNFALIKFRGSEGLTSELAVKGMYMDISNILKAIQEDIEVNVDFNVTYLLYDTYGKESEEIVIKATFNNETIKKIDFENFDYNNIPLIADDWWNMT